jgi:hypothetical protein
MRRNDYIESSSDFGEACPWCRATLDDATEVEDGGGASGGCLFFRTHFACPKCSYWMKTRCESFNILARADIGPPDMLTQRVRLDMAHAVMRLLMSRGIDSYEGARVWKTTPTQVTKAIGSGEVRFLFLVLAHLAHRYHERQADDLAARALELAADEMREMSPPEWDVLRDDPDMRNDAGWVVQSLTEKYRESGREPEATLDAARAALERAPNNRGPVSKS